MHAPVLTRRAFAAAIAGAALHAHAAWDEDALERLRTQLRSNANIRALLVERPERMPFAHFRADTTAQTRLPVASVTKSVTSLLAGIAIDRGVIADVEEPLSSLFPEFAKEPGAQDLERVRLKHLLSLSSGFDRGGLDANSDYPDLARRLYAPGLLEHALGRKLAGEPGARFYYSNLDAHLVAEAIARRVKMPLAQFAREALFKPLGIAGEEWPAGQDGVPDGAAGLRMTAADLAKIGRLMCGGGAWEGRQLVSKAYVGQATAKHVDSDLPARGPRELWGYGYLWWLSSTPGDNLRAFYAAGYGGQFIYCVPALQLVIVALTDQVSREVAGRTAVLIRDYALPAAR